MITRNRVSAVLLWVTICHLLVVYYLLDAICLAVFIFSPRATMAFFTRPQSASAAIKIVAPSTVSTDSTKSSPKKGRVP